MATVRELVAQFKLDVDEKGFKRVQKGFDTLKRNAAQAAGVVAGVAVGIGALTASFVEQVDTLNVLSNRLGLTKQQLQVWMELAKDAGIEGEQFADGVKDLTIKLGQMKKDGSDPASKALTELGINLDEFNKLSKNNKIKLVLTELGKLENAEKKAALAAAIAGDTGGQAFITLAEQVENYTAKREKLDQTGAIITDEEADSALELNAVLSDLKLTIAGLTQDLVVGLLPTIKELITDFTNWTAKNKDLIKTKIDDFIEGVKKVVKLLVPLVGFLIDNVDKLVIAFIAFKGLQISLALYDIAAGFAAILGGVGKNIAKIAILRKAVNGLYIRALIPLGAALSGAAAATWAFTVALLANPITWIVLAVIALVAGIVLLIKHWDKVKAAFKSAFKYIVDGLKKLGSFLADFAGDVLDFFLSIPGKVVDAIAWMVDRMFDLIAWSLGLIIEAVLALPETFRKMGRAVVKAFKWLAKNAWEGLKILFHKVVEGVKALPGVFYQFGKDVISFMKTLPGKTADAIKAIPGVFSDVFGKAWGAVGAGANAIFDRIKSALTGLVDFFKKNINKIIRAANKIPGVDIDLLQTEKMRKKRKEEMDKLIGPAPDLLKGKRQGPTAEQQKSLDDFFKKNKPLDEQKKQLNDFINKLTESNMFKSSSRVPTRETPQPVGLQTGFLGGARSVGIGAPPLSITASSPEVTVNVTNYLGTKEVKEIAREETKIEVNKTINNAANEP